MLWWVVVQLWSLMHKRKKWIQGILEKRWYPRGKKVKRRGEKKRKKEYKWLQIDKKKMFLHLKIKTYTKQNMSQKSMINKSYRPLFVVTHLCTDHLPGGQRTSHKPQKQAGSEWPASQRTRNAAIAWRIIRSLRSGPWAFFLSSVEGCRLLSPTAASSWA